MAFDWHLAVPSDGEAPAAFPAEERAFRTTVHDAFAVEHDADLGSHIIPSGNIATRNGLTWPATGSLYISNEDMASSTSPLQLHFRTGSSWYRIGEFVAGTKMLFAQASAPTFWTQSTDNDRLIRIVSGTGGGTGGSWSISGLANESASHTHGVVGTVGNNNQSHTHVVNTTTSGPSATVDCHGPAGGCLSASTAHTHAFIVSSSAESVPHYHAVSFTSGTESANHTHTGDGSWRPAYVNVIYAVKN